MDVLHLIKREPMPTVLIMVPSANGEAVVKPIDVRPALFSLKRRRVMGVVETAYGRSSTQAIPVDSGVLAGGPPATLVQTFADEVTAAGIYTGINFGDQTPGGVFTVQAAFNDNMTVPNAVVHNAQFQINTRTAEFLMLFATADDVVGLPIVPECGAANNIVVTWTGPAGVQISTELLTPKHPQLLALLNSDVDERLIRVELAKTGGA